MRSVSLTVVVAASTHNCDLDTVSGHLGSEVVEVALNGGWRCDILRRRHFVLSRFKAKRENNGTQVSNGKDQDACRKRGGLERMWSPQPRRIEPQGMEAVTSAAGGGGKIFLAAATKDEIQHVREVFFKTP